MDLCVYCKYPFNYYPVTTAIQNDLSSLFPWHFCVFFKKLEFLIS